ncbi:MAG: hypothetical protein K8R31_10855 [Bacteroidales bacterium]|nr:hypothetical protein [Bacteroidales bacterium]
MKKVLLPILIILIPVISFSQKSLIKDINLDINNDDVIVNYNLTNKQNFTHFVDFVLIDKYRNVYIPENTVGSIGTNIKSGKNSLSFNMLNQDFPLDRKLSPRIILDHNYKNGSKAALLSVLMPGLGDYFVENPKKMVIKPYYRTIAIGGFIALAIIADSKKSDVVYYEETKWVPETWRNPGYWTTETAEKSNPNNYWLFRNDKEIFLGVAASLWVFDIFWVLTKGQQNQNIKKALSNKNYKLELSGTGFSYKINLN